MRIDNLERELAFEQAQLMALCAAADAHHSKGSE